MTALVLADYDNFRNPSRDSEFDCEVSLSMIKAAIAKVERYIDNDDILVRLYGGWIDESGKYTQRAIFLMRMLFHLRTRIGRKIIKPELAFGRIGTNEKINGLFLSNRREQKMVDTLISVDSLNDNEYKELIFFSKDTDLIPPILQASVNKKIILVTSKCETIDSNHASMVKNNIITLVTNGERYA